MMMTDMKKNGDNCTYTVVLMVDTGQAVKNVIRRYDSNE